MKTAQKRVKSNKLRVNQVLAGIFKLLIIVPAIVLFFALFQTKAQAAIGINRTINFQGRVVNKSDGTNISDGTYSFTFKLYDAASSGNQLWTETQSSVTVTNGIFQVALGSTTAFSGAVNFNTNPLYLDITFNGETFGSRVQLAATPYAFNAETLDGVIATPSATGFTMTGGQSTPKTLTLSDSTTLGTNAITLGGGEVVTFTAGNALTLATTGSTNITLPTSGTLLTNTATANQTVTSTQTSGTVLGITDATNITAATTGLSITMSGTGAFDQTGLSFNLSGASGTNLNDIVGSGSTWKISRAGALTVASCSGCVSGGLNQVPTSNTAGAAGANVVAPTAAGIIGMTINGTSNSSTTADALDVNTIPATGLTATNGLLVQQNGAGTTTNGIQIQRTSGTLTNGLTFSGTIATDIALGTVASGSTGISGTLANTTAANATGLSLTNGTVTTSGTQTALNITTSTITTGGTQYGLNISASGIGAGTLQGINISGITQGAGAQTAVNIGSGWNNAISAAGNILIESKSNTSDANSLTWTDNSPSAGTLNTTTGIASISAMAVYNGSMYAGTTNLGKAEMYRYNSGTSWTAINSTAGTLKTTATIDGISAMAVYNGYLYVGTSKVNGGSGQAEVYRYDGGTGAGVFTSITSGTAGTIGATASVASVSAMTVYNGSLYIGICKSGAAQVMRYEGGTSWSIVGGKATPGTIQTTAGMDCINSLVAYNGQLIAGSSKVGSAEVYRYGGGVTWARLTLTTAGTFTVTNDMSAGSNASAVDAVTAMTVWNGKLIVGVKKASAGDILMYTGQVTTVAPTDTWFRLNNAAGTIVSGGATINAVSALGVYNGRLYAGTDTTAGAEIWRYDGGDGAGPAGWTKVSQTKGTIGSTGTPTSSINTITQLVQYNNDFWAGTGKPGAAEVYQYTFNAGSSYALKFHGVSTQAEQNGLENLGSISFEASPSANMGNGAFLFSNGIISNSGAYDVAEDYPSRDQLIRPGDLVAIDTAEKGLVKRSDSPNNTTVIGVYSAHPGFDLSQQGSLIDGIPAIPVALVGRVPVNVSTESGEIVAGDYITSSSLAGVGMKAIHAGPIIGQALEGYSGNDVGQILVFVSHGYFNGISQDSLAGLTGNSANLAIAQFIGTPGSTAFIDSGITASQSGQLGSLNATASGDLTLTSLSVSGLATFSADLRIEGNGLIEGILSVIDTLKTNNFIATGIADFFDNVVFHKDVTFAGRATFNTDTAGFAVIQKDTDRVTIVFDKEYENSPIVTTSISFNSPSQIPAQTPQDSLQQSILSQDYQYIIADKTNKGFTIVLNKRAKEDVVFSWVALSVKDAKTTTSGQVAGVSTQITPVPTLTLDNQSVATGSPTP